MPSQSPPKQDRARRTRERILVATEELLTDKLFEELSIDEIVAAATCSVGSFYHSFGDKEGLLPELYARHSKDVESRLARIMQANPDSQSTEQRIGKLARTLVRYHRQHRGLLRALVLRSHTHPATVSPERPKEMTTVIDRLAEWLVGSRDKRRQRAAAEAILMMLATIRECMLYPDTTAKALRITDAQLLKMLERMCVGHLGIAVSHSTSQRK